MQEIVLCKEIVNMCVDLKIKMELKWYMMITYSKRLFKDFIYTYTHMHLYAYTHKVYICTCMYVCI